MLVCLLVSKITRKQHDYDDFCFTFRVCVWGGEGVFENDPYDKNPLKFGEDLDAIAPNV